MNTNTYTTFGIQFLRNGAEENDDCLTVKPDGNGRYCVQMKFSKVMCVQNNGKTTETTMTHYELDNFLRNLFSILALDEGPYEFYQFDMPLMPSVILNQKRLPKIEQYVLDQLEEYENNMNWPTVMNNTATEKIRKVIYNDDGKPKHMWFED
jgi:hypothetical protein